MEITSILPNALITSKSGAGKLVRFCSQIIYNLACSANKFERARHKRVTGSDIGEKKVNNSVIRDTIHI